MGKIERASAEIERLEEEAYKESPLNSINPLVKLILTLAAIIASVSVRRGELASALLISSYPLSQFILFSIPLRPALKRLAPVFPFILLVGIFEPFLDKSPVFSLGGIVVTGGMLSFLSLTVKGLTTVLSAYLLAVSTPAKDIFSALRRLKLPAVIVSEIELIYRYLGLLLDEAGRVSAAYSLRAPGQKGIAFRAWGSLLGQLILRSIDRAELVYQSMLLRGFRGAYDAGKELSFSRADCFYLVFWLAALIILRFLPLLFTKGKI